MLLKYTINITANYLERKHNPIKIRYKNTFSAFCQGYLDMFVFVFFLSVSVL